MKIVGKRESFLLFAGDILFLFASLWLAVFLRNLATPERAISFTPHLIPFAILFVVWAIVFYIAGLYGRHTTSLRSRLPLTLLKALFFCASVSIIFFYLIPLFGITPKTILFIFLIISFFAVLFWRTNSYRLLGSKKITKVFLATSSDEAKELQEELSKNNIYNVQFVSDPEEASVVILDFSDEKARGLLPNLYRRLFFGVKFIDMHEMYEDIFDRVPLSAIKYDWFLDNISNNRSLAYDALKRLMDVLLSTVLLILSAPFDVLAMLAIKINDGGPVFIKQTRVGENNKLISIVKFRTMTGNDQGNYGQNGQTELKITKVGAILRKSRIDEFPQLWNVIRGDLSLVGPRPELPKLIEKYEKEIPYYNIRHIIKPGLSGWAQIYHENHPHHGTAVEETREKLSYDLYYIKNRSFILDLTIALKTIKTLLSIVGV